MTSVQVDLKPFCATYSARYALTEPFCHGGFEYATDSAIMIRVPTDKPDSPTFSGDGKQFPTAGNYWEMYKPNFKREFCDYFPVDYVDKLAPCLACEATGLASHELCVKCEGEGCTECFECGHESECGECDGDGFVGSGECEVCHGKRELIQPVLQRIGSDKYSIAVKYDRPIRGLPGPVTCRYVASEGCVPFRFNGGEGIVMCRNEV